MVYVGQKLNTAWLGGSGSGSGWGSLTRLQSKCWLRLKSSPGSTRGESFSKVIQWLLADLKPLLAPGQRYQLLTMWASPQSSLQQGSWFPSEWAGKKTRESLRSANIHWSYHVPLYPQAAGLTEWWNEFWKTVMMPARWQHLVDLEQCLPGYGIHSKSAFNIQSIYPWSGSEGIKVDWLFILLPLWFTRKTAVSRDHDFRLSWSKCLGSTGRNVCTGR